MKTIDIFPPPIDRDGPIDGGRQCMAHFSPGEVGELIQEQDSTIMLFPVKLAPPDCTLGIRIVASETAYYDSVKARIVKYSNCIKRNRMS